MDSSNMNSSENNKIENQFGYHTNNINDFCGSYTEEYVVKYKNHESLPKKFKVMTWNIWGMIKRNNGPKYMFLYELMILRMKKIIKQLIKNDPDIIIFQEVGYEALGLIRAYMRKYNILSKYNCYGENFRNLTPNNMEKNIGRDLENYVFAKHIPKKISQYSLSGNIGYTTGITLVSYDNISIIGCYLQAGSKHSPGQADVAHHYARCRGEQIVAIGKIIDEKCTDNTVILCGDFNMHLDGSEDEWPEIKEIYKLKLVDTWRNRYPDENKYPGFTEDTDINHMRWNMKFMEKHYRYDGILLKNGKDIKLKVDKCKLIGRKTYQLDDDMYKEFMDVLSNKSSSEHPKSKTYSASDHFGVMTTFLQS